jgi:methylated-DNA-protein-cysteine methyltransferase related protein
VAAVKKTGSAEVPPFTAVQRLVSQVPRGKVVTYGQLSQAIGGRLTPVGVGWAIRAAEEGSIPWQRVVNAKGRISTEGTLQRDMLESEGIVFDDEGAIDLSRFGLSALGGIRGSGRRGGPR